MWGGEELRQRGRAGCRWLTELLVLVGQYVETRGHLIHARRQLKGSDLDLFLGLGGSLGRAAGGRGPGDVPISEPRVLLWGRALHPFQATGCFAFPGSGPFIGLSTVGLAVSGGTE